MGNYTEDSKPPGYYIRQRLRRNKPAIFGLIVIIASFVFSILGYLIMPDDTPNANDGAVQIQKQPPGFTATFLKIRKNRVIDQKNFIQKAIYGQESEYMIVPIVDYEIEHLYVRAEIFGKLNYHKEYSILDIVKAKKGNPDEVTNESTGETMLIYENLNGLEESVSENDLINEFQEYNIEKRTYWLGTDKMGRDMLSRLSKFLKSFMNPITLPSGRY